MEDNQLVGYSNMTDALDQLRYEESRKKNFAMNKAEKLFDDFELQVAQSLADVHNFFKEEEIDKLIIQYPTRQDGSVFCYDKKKHKDVLNLCFLDGTSAFTDDTTLPTTIERQDDYLDVRTLFPFSIKDTQGNYLSDTIALRRSPDRSKLMRRKTGTHSILFNKKKPFATLEDSLRATYVGSIEQDKRPDTMAIESYIGIITDLTGVIARALKNPDKEKFSYNLITP